MIEEIQWVRYTCERCEKVWIPRTENLPSQCPSCQRRDWNKSEHLVDIVDESAEVAAIRSHPDYMSFVDERMRED